MIWSGLLSMLPTEPKAKPEAPKHDSYRVVAITNGLGTTYYDVEQYSMEYWRFFKRFDTQEKACACMKDRIESEERYRLACKIVSKVVVSCPCS